MEAQLRLRIEDETRRVRQDYREAVEIVENLKKRMNELERRLALEKPEEAGRDLTILKSVLNSLEELTDSEILKSKAAWKNYQELKHNCDTNNLMIPQLDELQLLCKKKEQLAADLLCYSLGHLRQNEQEKREAHC